MKTKTHTIQLPDGKALPATITIYRAKDAALPQHEELYRPDGGVWGVAEINHTDFNRVWWTVSTDSAREALGQLKAELERKAREALGFAPPNPFQVYMAHSIR